MHKIIKVKQICKHLNYVVVLAKTHDLNSGSDCKSLHPMEDLQIQSKTMLPGVIQNYRCPDQNLVLSNRFSREHVRDRETNHVMIASVKIANPANALSDAMK